MTIPELEQQLLSLTQSERQRLAQLLTQSLEPTTRQTASEAFSLADAIVHFRHQMSPEELDPNAADIWQGVRDQTPIAKEPRW